MRTSFASVSLTSLAVCFIALGSSACGGVDVEDGDADAESNLGVARSALTALTIEAEGSTGAGTTESDPTASGGQLLALTVVGSTASKPFVASGTVTSGTVRVRAHSPCASTQWIKVRVDGVDVLTQPVTSTTWTDLPLNVAGVSAGNHTIAFNYRAGLSSCPLRIDSVSLWMQDPPPPPPPPVVVEAETASGAGTIEADATASNGALLALTVVGSTATAPFTTTAATSAATVRARAVACGTQQWIKVVVDGNTVLTQPISSTSWTDIPLNVASLPAGPHTVGFNYRFGSSACALRFDKVTFN